MTPLTIALAAFWPISNITFTAGTAVGWFYNWSYESYGISLGDGVTAAFNGTATAPCVFARYNTVQEGGQRQLDATGWLAGITGQSYVNTAPNHIGPLHPLRNAQLRRQTSSGTTGFFLACQRRELRILGPGSLAVIMLRKTSPIAFSSEARRGCGGTMRQPIFPCKTAPSSEASLVADHTGGSDWPLTVANCAFDGNGHFHVGFDRKRDQHLL